MSIEKVFEPTPIIIKGKDCNSADSVMSCVDISGQLFRVDTEVGIDAQEWVSSSSVFATGGISAVTIGEDGPLHQYCKTSGFVRPLTVMFVSTDAGGNEQLLFTLSEGAADESGDCSLTISAQTPNAFFTITEPSADALGKDDWEKSDGAFPNPISKINVRDSSTGGDPYCCSLLTLGSEIGVNVLPAGISIPARGN